MKAASSSSSCLIAPVQGFHQPIASLVQNGYFLLLHLYQPLFVLCPQVLRIQGSSSQAVFLSQQLVEDLTSLGLLLVRIRISGVRIGGRACAALCLEFEFSLAQLDLKLFHGRSQFQNFLLVIRQGLGAVGSIGRRRRRRGVMVGVMVVLLAGPAGSRVVGVSMARYHLPGQGVTVTDGGGVGITLVLTRVCGIVAGVCLVQRHSRMCKHSRCPAHRRLLVQLVGVSHHRRLLAGHNVRIWMAVPTPAPNHHPGRRRLGAGR